MGTKDKQIKGEIMKIGDYVRTKNGDIGKIKENDGEIIKYCVGTLYGIDLDRNCLDREILKSSPNIIDLIEVGDYVNGYPVEKVYLPTNKKLGKIIRFATDNASGWECEAVEIYAEDIKSIVTKEQFESMKYEVK